MYDLETQLSKTMSDLEEKKNENTHLESSIRNFLEGHEEEVKIRKQFETNINALHSLQRNTELKYARAVEDIANMELLDKEQKKKLQELTKETNSLRREKETASI